MPGYTVDAELRPTDLRHCDVAGWFVPGAEVSDWLSVVLPSVESASALRFRILASSDRRNIGAVVTGCGKLTHPLCIPYGRLANRMLLPVSAKIFPAVKEAEIEALLSSTSLAEVVWHPVTGLTGVDEEQILSLEDLIEVGQPRASDWGRAVPGSYFNKRLVSVHPAEDLTPELVFEGGRDDIGTEADRLKDAPRSPGESPSAVLQDFVARMTSPLAKAARWFTGRVPAEATSPTWVNRLENWANRVLQHATVSQSRRLNELRRLLSMLNNDPDKGLRYAVPFGGDGAPRGTAPPSNQLAPHNVDFRSGGWSGAADTWGVPPDIAAALISRYQHLAQREIALGRYRRAAYIYATLLGDFSAAAQVLADGGFYREAAEVYRRKLRQPRKAAECLLHGGLWSEAVEIYEELKDWSSVADIHGKLGNKEESRVAWCEASRDYVRQNNFIRAAAVQEEHLGDVIAAEQLLRRGWSHSANARDCLAELFGLHARQENHHAASALVKEVGEDDRLAVTRQQCVAEILSGLSRSYPDQAVRSVAFDRSRRLVAHNLDTTDVRTRRRFLSVLESLIPGDRLLKRDCRRFEQAATATGRHRRPDRIVCLNRFSLRDDVQWQVATRSEPRTWVAGYHKDSLVLASWEDGPDPVVEYAHWYLRSELQDRILMTPSVDHAGGVFLSVVGLSTSTKDFACKSSALGARVRNLPWSDSSVVAAGNSGRGTVWTLELIAGAARIHGRKESGAPIISRVLPTLAEADASAAFIHPFGGGYVACVIGDTLISVRPGSQLTEADHSPAERFVVDTTTIDGEEIPENTPNFEEIALPHRVTSCCALKDRAQPQVALLFEEGGLVHWMKSSQQQRFGDGLPQPVATFLLNQDLVVTGRGGAIEVYRMQEQRLQIVTTFQGQPSQPIGVVATRGFGDGVTNEFLVIRQGGAVDVYDYQAP